MKKTNFKIGLMALSIVLAVTVVLASCKKKNGDDDDNDAGNNQSWIVGMWRYDPTSVYYAACQVFYANGSCFHIGIREYPATAERIIDMTKGKYRLNGNTLTVYEVTGFIMHSGSVVSGTPNYGSNYREIVRIVKSGSRSEVEKLTDPMNALYSAYTSSYGHWESWSDRDDKLEIINTDKFVTSWPKDATWTLERVR